MILGVYYYFEEVAALFLYIVRVNIMPRCRQTITYDQQKYPELNQNMLADRMKWLTRFTFHL